MAELNRQVAASADDCRVRWNGSSWDIDVTNSNQYAGYGSSTNKKIGSGARFTNIAIPKGSTIDAAYITLTSNSDRSGTTVNTKVRGEDADNPAQFSDIADYQGRPRTSAEVNWDDIGAWITGSEYNSPDIKTVIQEIIDRAGWSSGNALVVFWDDHDDRSTDQRRGYAYDDTPSKAAKLHIEYTEPAAGGARSHGYIMG